MNVFNKANLNIKMYFLPDLAAPKKYDICAILIGRHILVRTLSKECKELKPV